MSDEQRKSDVAYGLAEQPDSVPMLKARNGTAVLKVLSIIAPVWYIGWMAVVGMSWLKQPSETITYVFFAAILVYSIAHAISAFLEGRRRKNSVIKIMALVVLVCEAIVIIIFGLLLLLEKLVDSGVLPPMERLGNFISNKSNNFSGFDKSESGVSVGMILLWVVLGFIFVFPFITLFWSYWRRCVSNFKYFVSILKKCVVFKGRAQRKEYWFFVLHLWILYIIAFIAISASMIPADDTTSFFLGGLLITTLVLLFLGLAVTVRRMHDCNKKWAFMLIPVLNIVLLFLPGTKGENRFGSEPALQEKKI
jgi:uncharacterized membrane protein YhaH (DUF805 family)